MGTEREKAAVMGTQAAKESAETVELCRQFYIAAGIPIVLFSGKETIHWLRHGMLLDLCRQAGRAKLPENASTELLQYIRENLGEKLSLEGIAGNIGRSVSYTQKLFQRELLTSPGAYIAQCRAESAKELLLGQDSLAEIAYRLGYSSQAHFQTAFKKATGISPQQYRKSCR